MSMPQLSPDPADAVSGAQQLPTPSSRPLRHRRREKLAETIAYEIVEGLMEGRCVPGQTLPLEATMLEQYGVSRPTMREALRILEVQGILVLRPGRTGGPVYAGPSGEYLGRMASLHFHLQGSKMEDLLEARFLIEPAMAHGAARRQEPGAIALLRAFVDGDPEPDPTDDAYITAAPDFHMLLARVCGNGVLALLAEALRHIANATAVNVNWGGLGLPPEISNDVHDAHHEIAWAIIDGDPEKAEHLTRLHDRQTVEWFAVGDPRHHHRNVPWVR